MRLTGSYDGKAQTTTIAFESNCHTDGFPLVDRAIFYNADFDLSSPAFSLAGAILFGAFCGESIEFNGPRLSLDMVVALQILLPQLRAVAPVDGLRRDLLKSGEEVYCAEAGAPAASGIELRTGAVQLSSTTWSGDFAGMRGALPNLSRGAIFTNAFLVVGDSSVVSIATGLLFGGSRIGRLHVQDESVSPRLGAIRAALFSVGVELCMHCSERRSPAGTVTRAPGSGSK
jgi:hypothetical protein